MIYPTAPVGGWGYLWTRAQVVDYLNEAVVLTRKAPA